MTRERFEELEKACKDFCEIRWNGCRQIRDNANLMLRDAIRGENERRKNSKYFVYLRNVNHGTRNYPDIENALIIESISSCKETEKSFVSGHSRIDKNNIVAWLS